LVNTPRLLILDEPTVGLDPIARSEVWRQVRALQAGPARMTVLLTTHYMEEADAICDTVALMHRGQIRQVGSPVELKAGLGATATLDDVFRRYTSEDLEISDGQEGGLRDVRSTRRTIKRLG
jgi:ABC-2 type transport system ATP-binding protein